MSDALIRVEGASKKFCRSLKRSLWYGMCDLGSELIGRRHGGKGQLRRDEFWAVKDVSFELKRGECLGLVGRNGAGKTTLLRMLNGLIKPDGGRIEIRGRIGALIALGAGFNPILSGRENIYVNASVLGLTKKEIAGKLDEIVEFAEIGASIDAPVQSYSSGMQVRLGFSVATALTPDVLILDEVLAVGDTAFRAKCFQRIGALLDNSAVVFVSHDANQIRRICDRALLLDQGIVVDAGNPQEILSRYRGNSQQKSESRIMCHPKISSPLLQVNTPFVEWGEDLELQLEFYSGEELSIGLLLVHLARDDEFVSHANIQCDGLIAASGKNAWRLRVENLQLVAGRHFVSISIFSETRKATILHMLNAAVFDMAGDRGHGPPIRQRGSLEILGKGTAE